MVNRQWSIAGRELWTIDHRRSTMDYRPSAGVAARGSDRRHLARHQVQDLVLIPRRDDAAGVGLEPSGQIIVDSPRRREPALADQVGAVQTELHQLSLGEVLAQLVVRATADRQVIGG